MIKGGSALALRSSFVGEQDRELQFKYEDGLALWDALHALDVVPDLLRPRHCSTRPNWRLYQTRNV